MLWHRDTFDFLIKTDDDSFVVMGNLRARLAALDPDQELMMGHKLTDDGVMLRYLHLLI